jgi:conjugative transfer pilus assembly protein TraH
VPVYRMLALGYTGGSTGNDNYLTDLLINRYAGVIAYDYAYTFVARSLKDVRLYLGAARLQNVVEDEKAKRIRERLEAMLEAIERERTAAMQRVPQISSMIDDLQKIERQLRGGLPGSVRQMMDLSNLLTPGG